MKKGNTSVQQLIGIKEITNNSIILNRSNRSSVPGYDEAVFLIAKPTNISVLSQCSIAQKVNSLMQLLCSQSDIEIVCTDAKENYNGNKSYLDKRITEETNRLVQNLLQKDKSFLDDIQNRMSTSREFMFVLRYRNPNTSNTTRVVKMINELGFDCRQAKKMDIMRALQRYFDIESYDNEIDDFDGEGAVQRWVIGKGSV